MQSPSMGQDLHFPYHVKAATPLSKLLGSLAAFCVHLHCYPPPGLHTKSSIEPASIPLHYLSLRSALSWVEKLNKSERHRMLLLSLTMRLGYSTVHQQEIVQMADRWQ